MDQYPTTYSDARGSESTIIVNDGQELTVHLRGVRFVGHDFDSLEPKDATTEQLTQFNLCKGDLCSCRIQCRIPIPVQSPDKVHDGVMFSDLVLGDPAPNGGIDEERLSIVLQYDGQRIAGPGTSGWFEDELVQIQSQLPEGTFIKACINCLYSDYSPFGHGLFGGMMCFRNLKMEYLQVTSKEEFWSVHGRQDRFVQETYLCSEFERRIPGTGYRG